MAGVKPSRQEVYLTCSRTDADLSWPATVPGDNNGCSKGLRSNSVTGSLTPRQNQSRCRPHHHNRFIQPGAPREWELSSIFQAHEISFRWLRDAFLATDSRGFRVFVIALPLQKAPGERFRLLLRLTGPSSGLRWRLVGIELPDRARNQLVEQLVKREASALPP